MNPVIAVWMTFLPCGQAVPEIGLANILMGLPALLGKDFDSAKISLKIWIQLSFFGSYFPKKANLTGKTISASEFSIIIH